MSSHHQLTLGLCVVCVMIVFSSYMSYKAISDMRAEMQSFYGGSQLSGDESKGSNKIYTFQDVSQALHELKQDFNNRLQKLEKNIEDLKKSVSDSNVKAQLEELKKAINSNSGTNTNSDTQVVVNDDKKPSGLEKKRLVIGVLTAYAKPERRMAVRETWAQILKGTPQENDVAYKFFLADPRNEGILKTAKEEAEKYGDIVFFENFHDTYRNITRKSMGLVKWFVDHYDFDYLFKTDDDAFLRTDRLLEHLKTAPKEKYYTGISIGAYTPDRNPNSLYYVSEHDFPRKTGPSVIVGAGYVISHDCAEFMAKKAVDPKTIFIPLEDVNTAVVLEEYGVEGIPFNKFKPGTCPCTNDMILTHWCSPAELHKLYKKTKDTNGVSMC